MRYFIILGMLVLAGCQTTRMQSYVNPEYMDAPAYQSSVVVYAYGVERSERLIIEGRTVEQFEANGTTAIASGISFPFGTETDVKTFSQAIINTGVDAILVISGEGRKVNEVYVPPTTYGESSTTTTTFRGTAYNHGNSTSLSGTADSYTTYNPGYTTPGFTIEKPEANYSATVIDIGSGNVVWSAGANSSGSAFSSFEALARSMAEKSVQQLLEDKIF